MQAIHVTGSNSFLCQGDFLNGTSPSGELTMLKACFTIKTIHNYSGLIIVFYHSFSSCRVWGQRWDQDPVYCCADWAAHEAAGPCGGREMHPGWRSRWQVWDGRIHQQQKQGLSLLRPSVLGSCCLLLSAYFLFTLILNHWNDELKKCCVIWRTLSCIYRKQIICSLRIVETEYDELIWRKCRLGVTEKLVFYTAVTS